jgi:hypothetical protein
MMMSAAMATAHSTLQHGSSSHSCCTVGRWGGAGAQAIRGGAWKPDEGDALWGKLDGHVSRRLGYSWHCWQGVSWPLPLELAAIQPDGGAPETTF